MFRFTTRDLLWLMLVVGLAAGWYADHRWQASFDGVTVLPEYVTSKIHAGQMLELRLLPNGEIDARVVPYRP
jgi:hypothetical protein